MAAIEDKLINDQDRLTKLVIDLLENRASDDLATDGNSLDQIFQQNDYCSESGNQLMPTSAAHNLITSSSVVPAASTYTASGMEPDASDVPLDMLGWINVDPNQWTESDILNIIYYVADYFNQYHLTNASSGGSKSRAAAETGRTTAAAVNHNRNVAPDQLEGDVSCCRCDCHRKLVASFKPQNQQQINVSRLRGEMFQGVNGAQLQMMTRNDFVRRDSIYGSVLYDRVQAVLEMAAKWQKEANNNALADASCSPAKNTTDANLMATTLTTTTATTSAAATAVTTTTTNTTTDSQHVRLYEQMYDFDQHDMFDNVLIQDLHSKPVEGNAVASLTATVAASPSSRESEHDEQLSKWLSTSSACSSSSTYPWPGLFAPVHHSAPEASSNVEDREKTTPRRASWTATTGTDEINFSSSLDVGPTSWLNLGNNCNSANYHSSTDLPSRSQSDDNLEVKPQFQFLNFGPYKAAHLWEFMLSLLLNPAYSSGIGRIVQWEDMERGVFRINDSQRVAELWGKHKQNDSMNYEKLSRALRWCRTHGYFEALPKEGQYPKKLCFCFGPKALLWREQVAHSLATNSSQELLQ